MERKHKNENDERNTNTSPTHIKGKDVNQANQTNSGAGGSAIKEGSNNPSENAKRTTPEKDKEHQTKQNQERYKGSNADGMNTEINKKDK